MIRKIHALPHPAATKTTAATITTATTIITAATKISLRRVIMLAISMAALPIFSNAQSADYYVSPVDIPIYLSANFGEIRVNRFHTGIDIKTQGVVGKPLYAVADGYISRVTVAPGGYGRAIHIAHPNGTTSTYAHLDSFTEEVERWVRSERYRLNQSDLSVFPEAGQFPVRRGDRIGTAGNSGASGGPHLHFEIRRSADQRPINVMTRGWIRTAEKDMVHPRITRLYHIDTDTITGVPIHSRVRSYEVRATAGGGYSLTRTTPLPSGRSSFFVIEATDRRGDAANSFGIFRARISVDGDERVVFEKDELRFEDNRYACASTLYSVQRRSSWGQEAVMLATQSGNRLPMYKRSVERGAISFDGAGEKQVQITVEDDAGNESTISFSMTYDGVYTPPQRPEGRIARANGDFVHSSDGMAVLIPNGALYESIFYTQSIVNVVVTPRADSIRPLSPIYRTGDGAMPLHVAMKIGIGAPQLSDSQRSRACLAKVSDRGALTYLGGTWSNQSVNGSSRDFGMFCVVADEVAPRIRSSFASGADLSAKSSVTITASDNFSGIASFSGTIDGEWIIFERNVARGLFVHRFDLEKLQTGRMHTLEFTCRDGVGNTATWRGNFKK